MKVWVLTCPPSDCVDRHGQVTSYLSLNILKKSVIQIILLHMIVMKISDNIGEGNEKALNKLSALFTSIVYGSESSAGNIWMETKVFYLKVKKLEISTEHREVKGAPHLILQRSLTHLHFL